MSAMRPPRMPTSAASHGLPLPSSTRPFRISTSYRAGVCVKVAAAAASRIVQQRMSRVRTATFLLKDGDPATFAPVALSPSLKLRRTAVALGGGWSASFAVARVAVTRAEAGKDCLTTDVATLPAAWRALHREKRRKTAATNRIRSIVRANAALPAPESAKLAGLRYVSDGRTPGIRRVGSTRRVRYVAPNGDTVSNAAELRRISSLVIPPAWTDVWICPDPHGHLQATGRDARGRKQYRYHPRWREVRDEVTYGRRIAFPQAPPRIRPRTAADR